MKSKFAYLEKDHVAVVAEREVSEELGEHAVLVRMLGNNLCVWDDIKYWDPEQGNRNQGMSYPMSRTFTLGLEVNF